MIEETDEDRADRERLLDKVERGFWKRAGKRIFGATPKGPKEPRHD